MLVSSIGYFNQQSALMGDYSSRNQIARSNMQAGFGHVSEVNIPQNKNIFTRIVQNIKSLFSANKVANESTRVSYIA